MSERTFCHQLPEFEDRGYSPSNEYLLPATHIPRAERAWLGDWLTQVAEEDCASARDLLASRIELCRTPTTSRIADVLLEFWPRSIVTHDGRAWLLCAPPRPEFQSDWYYNLFQDWYLLPEATSPDAVADACRAAGIASSEVVDTLLLMGGLRDDFPPDNGSYADPAAALEELNFDFLPADFAGYAEWQAVSRAWRGSVSFFHEPTGDHLLVNRKGEFGWFLHDIPTIKLFAQDAREFCKKYATARQQALEQRRRWMFGFDYTSGYQ